MFLLKGGAKAGGRSLNLFGEDVSAPSYVIISSALIHLAISIFWYECKLYYCNPFRSFSSPITYNVYVMVKRSWAI
jgi:hypothetical protein